MKKFIITEKFVGYADIEVEAEIQSVEVDDKVYLYEEYMKIIFPEVQI